jgi:hypothetical protein
MDYFEIFAPQETVRFTNWYFGTNRRRRNRRWWFFGNCLFIVIFAFFIFAGLAMAIAIWAAVVAAIWAAQVLVTLAQALWWPVHALRENHGRIA